MWRDLPCFVIGTRWQLSQNIFNYILRLHFSPPEGRVASVSSYTIYLFYMKSEYVCSFNSCPWLNRKWVLLERNRQRWLWFAAFWFFPFIVIPSSVCSWACLWVYPSCRLSPELPGFQSSLYLPLQAFNWVRGCDSFNKQFASQCLRREGD